MSTAPPTAERQRTGSYPALGTRFGQYVLVRKLAEGGMAEIFLAKQRGAEGFERNVVIKRMLHHLSDMPDFVDMFLDEARLAARLSHPNIAQIHDLGMADGCYYICMEYLAGEDFSTVLQACNKKQQSIPIDIAARVVMNAALGLHFAHEFTDEAGAPLNIVHRDVSPSNVFVTYQGQVKLLDFGIAKAETRVTRTSTGVVKGKYNYMAPEQAQGQPVDRRADIHSLGVILYEALTRTRPFSRENEMALLRAVLVHDVKPPRELRPELPVELEQVVLKAMAKQPEQRYQTADAMATDLARFIGTTNASADLQLTTFLTQLFGEERKSNKMRIPALEKLVPAPSPDPMSFPIELTGVAASTTQKTQTLMSRPSKTGSTGTGSRAGATPTTEVRGPRWMGAAVLAALLLASTSALLVLKATLIPNHPTNPVASTPKPSDNTDPAQHPLAASPPPPPAQQRPQTPPPQPAAPLVQARPEPAVRGPLSAAEVERSINRRKALIYQCFETNRGDLPGERTHLQVNVIIRASKVIAETAEPFKGTSVGDCLEREIRRVKFPPHTDKEVRFALPLDFRPVGGPSGL